MNPLDIKDVSACKDCPALGTDHVPSAGNPYAKVVIISHTPSIEEVKRQTPFVNDTGGLLNLFLEEAGLDRDDVYMAHLLKCHPPGNRPPRKEELANCWKRWIKEELRILKPDILLILGKDTFTKLRCSPEHWRHGNVFQHGPFKAMCLYHPTWFLRRGLLTDFINSGQILKDLLNESKQDI